MCKSEKKMFLIMSDVLGLETRMLLPIVRANPIFHYATILCLCINSYTDDSTNFEPKDKKTKK